MDETDKRLIAALRKDARRAVSDLALDLGLSRTTVRARIDRLKARGEILGFSVVLKQDVQTDPIRALTLIGIEGRGTDRIIRQLERMREVRTVHSTNGRWDLIAELGTDTLEGLDLAIAQIRRMDGVATSETNLLLSTRAVG